MQLDNLVKIWDSANSDEAPPAPPTSPSRPPRASAVSPDARHTVSRDGARAFSPSDGAFSPDRAFLPDGARPSLRTGLRRGDGTQSHQGQEPMRKWSLHEPSFSGAGAARLPAMLLQRIRTSSSASPVRREASATGISSPDGTRGVSRVQPHLQAALQAGRQSLPSSILARSSDGKQTAFSPDGKRIRMLRMLASSEANVEEGAPHPVAPVDFGG